MVAIGLLAGLTGGATAAAVLGAARTDSVYERHTEFVEAPDAWVADTDGPWGPHNLDQHLDNEQVETSLELATLGMRPSGSGIFPTFDYVAAGSRDERFGVELARFRILEGRTYDHSRPEEVVITEEYADATGLSVGDRVEFESWTDEAIARVFESNFTEGLVPDGPRVELTVVGLAREVQDLPTVTASTGSVYLTTAFTERWEGPIGNVPDLGAVWLSAGSDGYPSFRDEVLAGAEEGGTFVLQPSADTAGVSGAVRAQVIALLVSAAVIAISGAVVVFATLARQLSFAAPDQEAMSAVGFTRADRQWAIVLVALPAAFTAGLIGWATTVAGSELLPVGTPGRVEPEPGLRFALVPQIGAAVVVAGVVLILAALAGRTIVGLAAQHAAVPAGSPRSLPFTRWLSGSPPGTIGMQFAFDRGRGGRSLPTRSALVGCTVGVIGISASLVFAASLGHLESTPRLSGASADLLVNASDPSQAGWRALAARLERTPEIDEVATLISVILEVDGQPLDGLVVDLRRGDPLLDAIVSGRVPQAGDEITVGSEVAENLGVGVGGNVAVTLSDGSRADYEVVGIAAFSNLIGTYNEMAAVLGDSADRFLVRDAAPFYGIAVGFADGVDAEAARAELLASSDIALAEAPGEAPRAVRNLAEISVFPQALAITIAVLAVGFLIHALASAARRRSGELAVLKALGFSRGQLREVTLVQATAIVGVSLVVGVPIGVALGRVTWSSTAENLGLVTEFRLPTLALLWPLAAIAVANLVGMVVSRLTANVSPAAELRAWRAE